MQHELYATQIGNKMAWRQDKNMLSTHIFLNMEKNYDPENSTD